MPYSSAKAWPLDVGTAYNNQEKLNSHNEMHPEEYINGLSSYAYPLALIHICLVAHQYFVNIVRSMLLNVSDPVSDVWDVLNEDSQNVIQKKMMQHR